jgi:ATP-dependent helicase/nuclease subunit B
LATTLDALLSPLQSRDEQSLAQHIDRLLLVLDALTPPEEILSAADQLFLDVMTGLKEGSAFHPVLPLSKAQHSIIAALAREMLRPPFNPDSQLVILGLAEARLVDAELAILGGLSEARWPEYPDTGPWLNRPMRDTLKLQQPERDIGVTAHDFVQGFCHPQVIVTWPKRVQGAPAIASRWVLRLQAVMAATGLKPEEQLDGTLQKWVRAIDAPHCFSPVKRPCARPPLDARPRKFSVSRVEKLVRDSYWIYANSILKLAPIEALGQNADHALRGSLIHAALHDWAKNLRAVPRSESLALLLASGQVAFKPYIDLPEVSQFWWPRFLRMAREFVELPLNNDVNMLVEVSGHVPFDAGGVEHILSARADRIDITRQSGLRIIDYKSGTPPTSAQMASGFAPQLTLEAAIAVRGGFKGLQAAAVDDAVYLKVGGTRDGVEEIRLKPDTTITVEAERALMRLTELLADYQKPSTGYIPRHNLEGEEDRSDYDHLSRRWEWQLAGSAL